MTLALVPLGMMGVLQTSTLSREVENRSQLQLLALTQTAVSGEKEALLRAQGAAQAIGVMAYRLGDTPDECRVFMRNFLHDHPEFSFAGFIPLNGLMVCSTAPNSIDYSQHDDFVRQLADPRASVTLLATPDVSTEAVLNFVQPVVNEGTLRGFLSLSLPAPGFVTMPDMSASGAQKPDSLILFNAAGDLLTVELGPRIDAPAVPVGLSLQSHVGRGAKAFKAMSGTGQERAFAVIPVVPDVVYAMASWPQGATGIGGISLRLPALFTPVIMWLASLAVVSFAIHRLVLRHVLQLGKRMRRFARDRHLGKRTEGMAIAAELAELDAEFKRLAQTIVQDEAEMENALREKNILLKEVHHRVKNNLQMISSIMNMKVRSARNSETRRVIEQLQRRVLDLAQVHRQLYVSENLARADAGDMLRKVLEPLTDTLRDGTATQVEVRMQFDAIDLVPDQLVALSLLASEAASNAVKYVGKPEGGPAWIDVWLKSHDADANDAPQVTFGCANSLGPRPVLPVNDLADDTDTGGLGTLLIRAFSMQLGGPVQIERDAARHSVTSTFAISTKDQMAGVDY
ncbi:MAG: sensor histidine kinase [Pseudomonadota bacterium]